MSKLQYREYYRRHLPHFQPKGFTFFITFRLAGSLPVDIVERLTLEARQIDASFSTLTKSLDGYRQMEQARQRVFEKWDIALQRANCGEPFLEDVRVASVVADSIKYHDEDWFDLVAYCIMPNHVHLVLAPRAKSPLADYSLAEIMHNIKRNSAKQANSILKRTGAFWQHENYDHVVRDETELKRIVQYVLNNPVQAGLVANWKDWQWSYTKYEM